MGISFLALAPWAVMAQEPSASRDLSARTGIAFQAEPIQSQSIYSLSTADSAMNVGLRSNPRTRSLFAEAALARAERSNGRALPNPEADFALRKNGDQSHWELGIMGDVNGLLLYPWKRGTANLRYQAALSRLASEAAEQNGEVRRAWYRAVAAMQTQGFVAQTSSTWEAAAELARRQRDAGTMNALDLAEVEAAATEARLELRSAEAVTSEAKENLARFLGLPASRWTLPEVLPDPSGEDPTLSSLESMASNRNAGLVAAREEAIAAEKAHTLSWLEVLPSLKAGFSVERDDAGKNFVGPAIAAEIPLFNLGIPKRARTRAEMDLGRLRLATAEAELGPEIRRHYQAVVTARRNHEEIVKTLLPQREQATAEAQKQYNFMLTGVYRLLTSRREELSAHKMAVETLRDYWIEKTELEQMIGVSSPSSPSTSPDLSSKPEATEPHHHGADQ